MDTRPFADPPASLSVLGLGCSRIGSIGNRTPLEEIRRTLARARDLGVTVFDTANIYGQGDSEREIGRAFAQNRDEVFVVTKLGKHFSTKMRMIRPLKPLLAPLLARMPAAKNSVVARRGDNMGEDFSPGRFMPELEASLRRLRFDHVDALLLHSPPAAVLAVPGVTEALQELVASGKARFFGVSVDDYACLAAAVRIPGLTLVQAPLDVLDEAGRTGLASEIAERRIGVFGREVIQARPDLTPPAAVAAAAARPDVTCVVAGASRIAHLEQLVEAVAAPARAVPA